MLRYMLDTNICIYTIKNSPIAVRDKFQQHQHHMCINSIVLSELLYGAERSNNPARSLALVEGMAARLEVLHFDDAAAAHAADIRADLARKGTPIGDYDVLIAGHARSRGLILVSNNVREFERVMGLRLENWAV